MSYQCERCGEWIFRNETSLEKKRELMALHWAAMHSEDPGTIWRLGKPASVN